MIIATDGAVRVSKNIGGIGVVWTQDDKILGTYSKQIPAPTTISRCEILGVIYALAAIKKSYNDPIELYSDSMYVIGTLTKNWQRKANHDLWSTLDKQIDRVTKLGNKLEFKWCKGHTNKSDNISRLNDIVDNLAVDASHLL